MRFAPLFHDHAVLQREQPIPVWGSGTPGERVVVRLAGNSAGTVVDERGCWMLRLPALPAGGPHQLVAEAPSGGVVATDILIGEVWVCSGQSNMEWTLSACGAAQEPTDYGLPQVRLLTVKTPARLGRPAALAGAWQVCNRTVLQEFSAVGAHFGLALHAALGVPIGLICNAWGGTRVQAWISREGLMQDAAGRVEIAHYEAAIANAIDATAPMTFAEWERTGAPQDTGNRGLGLGWAGPDFADGGWRSMDLPARWQDVGHQFSGIFWFRRSVVVPPALRGRDLELHLGAIDKHDDTWVNGQRVGGLSWDDGPMTWCTKRVYRVPAALVPADGRVCIAIRARSHVYQGGFISSADSMELRPVGGDGSGGLPLAGAWRFEIEVNWGLVSPPALPWGPDNPNSPYMMFDNRLAPLLPYGIRGAIWYQGESNAEEAPLYRRQFPAMIRDWRRAWGQGDFPFLFVQLANYKTPECKAGLRSEWAELRDAQTATLAEPATGMAVAIDVGEAFDIHPKDKRSVGQRLAAWALGTTYGQRVVPSGPLYSSGVIESDGRVRCRFHHAAGLAARGGEALRGFAIADINRVWRWAEAVIEGETVVVHHPDVRNPAAVRYAWADNPVGCNLINGAGLPASPFRSDDWPT